MAALLSTLGMLIGTIGIFLGFYYLSENTPKTLHLVSITTVGIPGILAFARHVLFYKSDAKRLGWETDRPDWMFEVGFANLSFGIISFIAFLLNLPLYAQAVIILGYAIYLFQASLLHVYRYFTDSKRIRARFWRSCISTLIYSSMISFFAIRGLLL